MIRVKRDDLIVEIPDCVCIFFGAVRVLEHARCPDPNHWHDGKTWRVVGLPAERLRPGD